MSKLRITVVGAGLMGAGVAHAFARKGCQVSLYSRRSQTLEEARRSIMAAESRLAVSQSGQSEYVSTIMFTDSLEQALADAQLVSENVSEDLLLKQEILARIESGVSGDCLITTNTSSVPISSLASALKDPGRFLGMHWFNPPVLMPLVELIAGKETLESAMDQVETITRSIGKTTIRVRADIPGFVVNRIQYAVLREALHLVESGVASIEDVDKAVKSTLAPRWAAAGPLELMDMAGLDTVIRVSDILLRELSHTVEPSRILQRLVQEGSLGCRSGQGFYSWTPERVEEVRELRDRTVNRLMAMDEQALGGSSL
ncbi:NAD-binding protein [Paenibacillus sp. 7124]|uniref:NAD-binding protein n=1 Tax=Paenibacillus apii TaxID=1850370 RepID=A0A6M1PG25_9BACL|nr:3-hydroxyacyl-CoA dehydrogenase NAD-binding domain-containing protein [Paenibacillus apii]NGM82439.1 NAD-binding protein [Paenibacillus apii]NJJ39576.1 NAD-binding protein [Paenibacillus apii]